MIIKFITIKVDDLAKSLHFYQDILGFREVRRIDSMVDLTMVFLQDSDGGIVELIYNALEEETIETANHSKISFGISVENMNDTIALLEKYNLSLDKGPIVTPSGEVIGFMYDPNGVEIEFIEGFNI